MSDVSTLYKKPKTLKSAFQQPKPILKWVGGKTQLLQQYDRYFPEKFEQYIEPMVGGGAVFFHLYNTRRLKDGAVLIDNNKELINTYKVVKNNLSELISLLKKFKQEYEKNPEDFYYKIRKWDRKDDWSRRSNLEKAGRTIFLNKTCYNGLYRVNSKGQFNTPIGRYSDPTICDGNNLKAVNIIFQKAKLLGDDFKEVVSLANKGGFIYFDPPYHPLSETANFTSYTKQDFDKDDQARLRNTFKKLSEKGCKVMLSNSDTDFIRNLYKSFNINEVYARRHVNSKSDGRGKISELVITNY